MTDIFIKSFNRAFYLDRCLTSVYKNVTGNFKIKILDDGTPKKYLDKIREKHPQVEIFLSDSYDNKTKAVAENLISGQAVNGFLIPTKFWYDNVEKASEYVIVTEDDVWFTEPLNVDELSAEAKKLNIHLLKLGWLGNLLERNELHLKSIGKNIESAQPKDLLLMPEKLMEAFFYNRFKFFSLLYKLGKVDNRTRVKYWALNSILMGFFRKEYWLEIWKNMDGKVDEKRQLINASVAYKKQRNNPNFISRLKTESMKTTFQSSASNSYHEYGFDFDANQFNHFINEAWLSGELDPMQNYPKDFSLDYFKTFLDGKMNLEEYDKWVIQFRKQYENTGCDTN